MSVHVGFVVDEVVLGQDFLQVLRVSPANIVLQWFSILTYPIEMNNSKLPFITVKDGELKSF
jgi:hypothetical protein